MTEPHDSDSRAALPIWQLVTLSIYWFGIVIIWGGLNKIILPAMIGAQPGGAENLGILLAILVTVGVVAPIVVQPTGRHDQRLHGDPLGPAEAVHLHRRAARRRLPVRDCHIPDVPGAGRLLLPAAAQLELRPGPVPGLRSRPRPEAPGRPGERADGDDDRARHDRRGRDRQLRGEHRKPLPRHDGARRGGAGHDDRARHHGPRGNGSAAADTVVARGCPLGVVNATSSASRACCGSSSCGSCSSGRTPRRHSPCRTSSASMA